MNKKMLKNTKVGRVVSRLLGEEAGATMMEYVILAVMIAAAVTAAAIYFGNTAKNQMDIAGSAMAGKVDDSTTKAVESQKQQELDAKSAHTAAQKFSTGTDLKRKAGK